MKVAKTIEVEVCDSCGKENPIQRMCCLCKNMACDGCAEIMHVNVEKHSPNKYADGGFSTRVSRVGNSINRFYCLRCAPKVMEAMRAVGLIV